VSRATKSYAVKNTEHEIVLVQVTLKCNSLHKKKRIQL